MLVVYGMKCALVKRLAQGESHSKQAGYTLVVSCFRGVK